MKTKQKPQNYFVEREPAGGKGGRRKNRKNACKKIKKSWIQEIASAIQDHEDPEIKSRRLVGRVGQVGGWIVGAVIGMAVALCLVWLPKMAAVGLARVGQVMKQVYVWSVSLFLMLVFTPCVCEQMYT